MMQRPHYALCTARQLSYLAEFMVAYACPPELFDLAKSEILNGHILFGKHKNQVFLKEDICTLPQLLPLLPQLLDSTGGFDEAA